MEGNVGKTGSGQEASVTCRGKEIRLLGEREGEGDGGYARERGRMYMGVDSCKLLIVDSGISERKSVSPVISSPARSRLLPRLRTRSRRHCATSGMGCSRSENVMSAGCWSLLMLSLVFTRSKVVILLSRLTAALSRSGHSDRFTNSNASATSSTSRKGSTLRVPRASLRLDEGSPTACSSEAPDVSLNSWRVAATFRPMPDPGCAGSVSPSVGVEDDEEAESELDMLEFREMGRIAFVGERFRELLRIGTTPEGRVSALDMGFRDEDNFSVL